MSGGPELPSARVERVLPAPPQTVYDAWLDERSLEQFMCPAPGQATEVEVDARVGGRLRVVMSFPDGETEITGRWVALDRPERLSFTWRGGHEEADSVVTVLLAPHGEDETLMTIIHSLGLPLLVPRYRTGWTSVADRLAGLLSR